MKQVHKLSNCSFFMCNLEFIDPSDRHLSVAYMPLEQKQQWAKTTLKEICVLCLYFCCHRKDKLYVFSCWLVTKVPCHQKVFLLYFICIRLNINFVIKRNCTADLLFDSLNDKSWFHKQGTKRETKPLNKKQKNQPFIQQIKKKHID